MVSSTPQTFEESKVIETSDSHWKAIEPDSTRSISVKEIQPTIHLAGLSFDPHAADLSHYNSAWDTSKSTSLYLVQLFINDATVMVELESEYGIEVLHRQSQGVYLVRVHDVGQIGLISSNEDVRWIGAYEPYMRATNDVLGSHLIHVTLTSDIDSSHVAEMAAHLVQHGASSSWCSIDMCEAVFEHGLNPHQLRLVASHEDVFFVERTYDLALHNNIAATEVGAVAVRAPNSLGLDGSGETIAVMDTGLDNDHPDLIGRVAAINTQYGLDPSPVDSNSGHGTHVVMTVLGDGSGDASTTGLAPKANLVMYALEHDPTGYFGRQGSIYDLLSDAELKTARVAVNAWGSNGNFGYYTADSRSADQYVSNNQYLLPVFSVGDNGASGASKVTAPGTAKNVLSVGSSNNGSVSASSSQGPTLDGRIKPDLVAPGEGICSARAEEAKSVVGSVCATGTHSNTRSMYMELSGTSQATAVASGSAALAREYLREVAGINKPSASLIKATLVNGAEDLGTPDIPNSNEGWGQIDLENSLEPSHAGAALDIFHDDARELQAGFSLLYSFTMDASKGIDLTLAWSDVEGSANAPQAESRLMNDLDLVLLAPDGTTYLGNNFANGVSVSGGTADNLNNIERVRIPAGTNTQSGEWMVMVEHRGGSNQRFSVVMAADATLIPKADLTTFGNSILPSSSTPLVGDLVSISLAWHNQGTLASGAYRIQLEDVTDGSILYDSNRSSLGGGELDSVSFFTQFSTTGIHTLRLSLDTNNQVVELNDGVTGTNNNILEMDIEVTAQGLRVIFLGDDGSIPQSSTERDAAANVEMDVRNETGLSLPFVIVHEGTGERPVSLTVSGVQEPDLIYPAILNSPEDQWSRIVNLSGPFTLSGQGTENDTVYLQLELEDLSATLDASTERFARAGTFVVDVTARYQNQPTVSHTQRLTFTIEQVDSVDVVPSGTVGVQAQPGDDTGFSIGVRNTGNSAAQYTMSCTSASQWQIMLGNSNSSTLEFEPLNILQDLSMDVNVFVPSVADGQPSAGYIDQVTCVVTSPTDPTLNHVEVVNVAVAELRSFKSDLYGPSGAIGPGALAAPVFADTGDVVYYNHTISNNGNTDMDFIVSLERGNPAWAAQMTYLEASSSTNLNLNLAAGQSADVQLMLLVPETAREGNSNTYTIRVEHSSQYFTLNTTSLVVSDNLAVELEQVDDGTVSAVIGENFTFVNLIVSNTGNADLDLVWSYGLAPDGWTVNYANPPASVEVLKQANVALAILPPNQTQEATGFDLQLYVNASNNGRYVTEELTIRVEVPASEFAGLSTDASEAPLLFIPRGGSAEQTFVLVNEGNQPLSGTLSAEVRDSEGMVLSDRKARVSPSTISDLAVGQSIEIVGDVKPDTDAADGRYQLIIIFTSEEGVVVEFSADTSVSAQQSTGGLLNMSPFIAYPLLAVFAVALVLGARRLKSSAKLNDSGTDLVSPDAHTNPDHLGTRRDEALDISHSVNDIASGEVSQDEIAAALAQSLDMPLPQAMPPAGLPPAGLPPIGLPPVGLPPAGLPPTPVKEVPALPTGPPLPPGGLPNGWTMEQWQHYGEQYLQRMGLK
ncbi:MAG: S8 family serine peptidase [Candidatus Poseidoniaceae archaeon]